MPQYTRVMNPRNPSPEAMAEWQLGSMPLGACVELLDCQDQLVYRGFVMEQRGTWGYTKVLPTAEGDGNFIGTGETGTLSRIFAMSDVHYVCSERGVRLVYVDEEVASTLTVELEASESRLAGRVSTQKPGDSVTGAVAAISLLPVVSLLPFEEGAE